MVCAMKDNRYRMLSLFTHALLVARPMPNPHRMPREHGAIENKGAAIQRGCAACEKWRN
jgi:hypothetical protein